MEKVRNALNAAHRYVLPLLGSVYFFLGEFRSVPFVSEVMGAIIICILVLGIVLSLGNDFDGALLIDTTDPDKDIYRLDLGENFDSLAHKKEIRLKVDKEARLRE